MLYKITYILYYAYNIAYMQHSMTTKHFCAFGEFMCKLKNYHVTRHKINEGTLIHLSNDNHTFDILNNGFSISICQSNKNGVAMQKKNLIKIKIKPSHKRPLSGISMLHFTSDEITFAPSGFPMLRFGFSNGHSNVYTVIDDQRDDLVFRIIRDDGGNRESLFNMQQAIHELWSQKRTHFLYQALITVKHKMTGHSICSFHAVACAITPGEAVIKLRTSALIRTKYTHFIEVEIHDVSIIEYSSFVN
jgi:hypothetical protein